MCVRSGRGNSSVRILGVAGAVTTNEVQNLSPQRPRFAREFAETSDYILEPSWRGTRVLAVVGPRPAFIGYGGEPVDGPRGLLDAIAAATESDRAVIDGVIVHEFNEESALEADAQGEAFLRRAPARDVFVAVDLLEVDGMSLVDSPLLERKRHLASVLRTGPSVRISPYVRRGMREWRETLSEQGFKRYIVKRVNSRYRAGESNDDWLQIEKL